MWRTQNSLQYVHKSFKVGCPIHYLAVRLGLKVYMWPNLFHRQNYLVIRGVLMVVEWEIVLARMIEVKNLSLGFIDRGAIEPINVSYKNINRYLNLHYINRPYDSFLVKLKTLFFSRETFVMVYVAYCWVNKMLQTRWISDGSCLLPTESTWWWLNDTDKWSETIKIHKYQYS